MVPAGTVQNLPGIAELPKDEISGDAAALQWIVGNSVLGAAKQHISLGFPTGPGQESASGGQEYQIDAVSRTFSHQGRGGSGIGEQVNALQNVQWESSKDGVLLFYYHVLPVQGGIGILRGDE
jgi:hypothetical protein